MKPRIWQLTDAREKLEELVAAAAAGDAQAIVTAGGQEVFVVSRKYLEESRSSSDRSVLNRQPSDWEEDAFDEAMKTVREGPLHLGGTRPKGRGD